MFPDDDEFEFVGPDRGWNYEPSRAELFKQFRSPLYTTDADGWLTYYNDAAAELWGYRPELGKTRWCGAWRIFTTEGAPLPLDQCPMAVAIREGRLVRGVQAVLERPDGTRISFMPYPTPLRDASGAVVAASNQLVQITDLGRRDRPETLGADGPEPGFDDLTRDLQSTLAARADVEFAYRVDCERLEGWTGPAAEKRTILQQIEQRRQRRRAALDRRLDELQRRTTEAMAPESPSPESMAPGDAMAAAWMRAFWPQPTSLH
ncbi:histidine kinase [Methylobacterium sp. Leaf104]|nr:PAS domain-containing protein [Methylobacterium goesingense]KQP33782.1 histidine kinase [Methylobacterium sp. Leaf104]